MKINSSSDRTAAAYPIRKLTHDDSHLTYVMDLGQSVGDVHCDVVDNTLIVVRENGPESEEFELSLPPGEQRTFMKNGILTIEVKQ